MHIDNHHQIPDIIGIMSQDIANLIDKAQKIVVIQAENPDGDSLGSSLALEEILSDLGKDPILFCAIDIPKYMRYINGWDRVTSDWPRDADLAIIVDTSSQTLLVKTLEIPGVRHFFESHPVIVIDHHDSVESDLPFEHTYHSEVAVATSEIIYRISKDNGWTVNEQAAEQLFIALQSDSLGLTTPSTSADSYQVAADLVRLGAKPSEIENRRREYMKKPADILSYKAKLIEKIEYFLDGELAAVHIPWEEIEEYSDRYNPGALIIDEMRLVDTVQVAVAVKTYPDGKLTAKIRTNLPIADMVAGYFGGGGHSYAAGFKVYEAYDTVMKELVESVDKSLKENS